jgi:hypothetical protein
MITFETKPCPVCHQTSLVEMTEEQLKEFLSGEKFVQFIFPEWPADQRELLITGTHSKCWDELWEEEE